MKAKIDEILNKLRTKIVKKIAGKAELLLLSVESSLIHSFEALEEEQINESGEYNFIDGR